MKATYVEVNGIGREIFKDPITDDGTKKSAKGICYATQNLELVDQTTWNDFNSKNNGMNLVFENGVIHNRQTLGDIRNLIKN